MKSIILAILIASLGIFAIRAIWPPPEQVNSTSAAALLLSPAFASQTDSKLIHKPATAPQLMIGLYQLDSCLAWIHHAFETVLGRPPGDKDALRWLIDCGQSDLLAMPLNLMISDEFATRADRGPTDREEVAVFVEKLWSYVGNILDDHKQRMSTDDRNQRISQVLAQYPRQLRQSERIANSALQVFMDELTLDKRELKNEPLSGTELIFFGATGRHMNEVEIATELSADQEATKKPKFSALFAQVRPLLTKGMRADPKVTKLSAIDSLNMSPACTPLKCLRMRLANELFPFSLSPKRVDRMCRLFKPVRLHSLAPFERQALDNKPPCFRFIDEVAAFGLEVGILDRDRSPLTEIAR